MNYSTAIFLISDQVRAVLVSYEPPEIEGREPTMTLFKTFDTNIKVGDYVVVPTDTRHGMTVCKVEAVDVEPDLETAKEVKWIVGVVSRADFEQIRHQEDEAITAIKSAEKRRKRDELRKSLLADVPEDELKRLPMYSDAADSSAK